MKTFLQPITYKLQANRGMTFIELIVVIGIFATITGVVLFNFTGFTTSISLQNLANQIALQLKKAQTEALSGTGGGALFGTNRPSYGIHFETANPSHFYYFADIDNGGVIDSTAFCPGANSECLDDITIQTGDTIINLAASNCPLNTGLDITFQRPFPDAIFHEDGIIQSPQPSKIGIEIKSSKGTKKTILVWSTGQIEIKNGPINVDFPICP